MSTVIHMYLTSKDFEAVPALYGSYYMEQFAFFVKSAITLNIFKKLLQETFLKSDVFLLYLHVSAVFFV